MRLLQIAPAAGEGEVLDLHPIFTVVTGLGAPGRALVRDVSDGLSRGKVPGCVGLLECHGIFLDLTPEMLGLLDMNHPVQAMVTTEEVARALERNVTAETSQGVRPGSSLAAFEDDPEAAIDRVAPGEHPELDDARSEQQDSREALTILREAADHAREELDETARRRRRAEAALAAAQSGGEGADVLLANASSAHRGELEDELARVERGIAELSGIDTRPIEVLLDAIRDPEPVDYVPSQRAAELADDFEQLQQDVERLEAALDREGAGASAAMERLEAARARVIEAERAMRKPDLSPEQVAELEAAHDEVIEAERKATGALVGRKSAARRLEEAREREQAILDDVGYPTWSSYVMGASLWSVDPQAEDRLDRAKFELEAAEAAWADLTAAIEANPEHARLLDRLEAVYVEAVDLLGGEPEDGDLAKALRDLRVPDREIGTGDLVDALVYQLELVGMELGANAVLDTVVAVADAFLAEAAGVSDRIAELRDRRAELDAELARTDVQAGESGSEPVVDLTSPASGDMAERERELAEATEAEAAAAELLDARMALVDAAIQMESVASARCRRIAAEIFGVDAEAEPSSGGSTGGGDEPDEIRDALEMYLLARMADARSVSYAGSVPVVLDDALSSLAPATVQTVLDKLDRMAEAVQVIYLSDDPTITSWAENAGFERAAVVQAPPSMS